MDVKVTNGDLAVQATGIYERISGVDAAVQQVMAAMLTRKGSFRYDRNFGTDYNGVDRQDELLTEVLDMRLKEACADLCGATVTVKQADGGTARAWLTVRYREEERTVEVDLSGIL